MQMSMDECVQILSEGTDLKVLWREFDVSRLVIFREKLLYLIDKSMSVADAGMTEAIGDLGTKKMLDAVASADKLLNMLDRVSGLQSRISLDTAIEEVSKAGYTITGGDITPVEEPEETFKKVAFQKIKELFDETAK